MVIYQKKLRGRERKKARENENLRATVLICFDTKLALQSPRTFLNSYTPKMWSPLIYSL